MRAPGFLSLQRNAGGRLFHSGAELNAFIQQVNAAADSAASRCRWSRMRSSTTVSIRLIFASQKSFSLGERVKFEPTWKCSISSMSPMCWVFRKSITPGFANVLVRDSNDPNNPGFLRSSSFGQPVTTAGGVFGSGGPRAFQLAARFSF